MLFNSMISQTVFSCISWVSGRASGLYKRTYCSSLPRFCLRTWFDLD